MGLQRLEKRMQQLEGWLRSGMAREGIVGEPADAIVRSITSFALDGFSVVARGELLRCRRRQCLPREH